MKIESCIFPEGLFYDIENFVWADVKTTKAVTIGITSVLSSISGKLSAIKIKDVGTHVEAGKSLATIESSKYFGLVRAPFTGRIIELNNVIIHKPKLVNNFPYSEGWFAKMEPLYTDRYLVNLQPIQDCRDKMKTVIQNLHTRCFVAYPDYEMYEIGVECAATLTKLDDLLSNIEIGGIVHLVSDDNTADLEMTRWSEEKGQSILETRPEGNLLHFIIKKTK